MSNRAHASIFALALGLAPLAAIGCSGAQGDESTSEIQSALEQDNGGMTTAAEQPAFGDPAVEATPALVDTFADAKDPTADVAAKPGAQRYHLVVLWGHLPPAADQEDTQATPAPIDWTGQLSVDEGAIGVRRTLRFEPKDGLAPRAEPNVVAFTSHTLPRVDGLLLAVVVPAGGAQVLHFQTSALTADIDLASLAQKGGGVSPLGDGRNGMAYIGFQDEPGIAKGYVLGQWGKLEADIGRLRGRVVDGDGQPLGHVKGIWGHAPKKDKDLFFGKYIDAAGQFRGLFGGEYGQGALHGKWGVKGPSAVGVVEGRYSDGYEQGDDRGFFIARWSEAAK